MIGFDRFLEAPRSVRTTDQGWYGLQFVSTGQKIEFQLSFFVFGFFPQTSLGKMKIVFGRNTLGSCIHNLTAFKLIRLVPLAS